MRVAEAHTLQQLEKVVLRREEISDKAMMKTLWIDEKTLDRVNQHTLEHTSEWEESLCYSAASGLWATTQGYTQTAATPPGDRETLIQALSVSSTHPLLSKKAISNTSCLCSAERWAGEPGNSWEVIVTEQ